MRGAAGPHGDRVPEDAHVVIVHTGEGLPFVYGPFMGEGEADAAMAPIEDRLGIDAEDGHEDTLVWVVPLIAMTHDMWMDTTR